MKRYKSILFFIIGLFICLSVFKINYEEVIKILYTFPKRSIHLFISLFLSYLSLKISYLMISQYFEIQEQVIVRKGYSYFHKLIFIKSMIFICIFILIHTFLLLLFFRKIYLPGLIILLCIELLSGYLFIFLEKYLKSYTLVSLFMFQIILRIFLSFFL